MFTNSFIEYSILGESLLMYLWDYVLLGSWCWLCTHKNSVVRMTALTAAFQQLLKRTQPAPNQVDVLQGSGKR